MGLLKIRKRLIEKDKITSQIIQNNNENSNTSIKKEVKEYNKNSNIRFTVEQINDCLNKIKIGAALDGRVAPDSNGKSYSEYAENLLKINGRFSKTNYNIWVSIKKREVSVKEFKEVLFDYLFNYSGRSAKFFIDKNIGINQWQSMKKELSLHGTYQGEVIIDFAKYGAINIRNLFLYIRNKNYITCKTSRIYNLDKNIQKQYNMIEHYLFKTL